MEREKPTKEQLVAVLHDPSTRGRRGSAVYALRAYDCSDLLPELVLCVLDGTYEEVCHAIQILQNMDADVPLGFVDSAVEQLRERIATTTDWRREALEICLDMFEDVDRAPPRPRIRAHA